MRYRAAPMSTASPGIAATTCRRARAGQTGTAVKMIEDHYGHITPVKNSDRILLGLPGWQSTAADMAQAGR